MKKDLHCIRLVFLTALLFLGNYAFSQSVVMFELIDAEENIVIEELGDNDTIFLDETVDSLNIIAITEPDPLLATHKVKFDLNGEHTQLEGVAPYACWGDISGDYRKRSFDSLVGANVLYASPVLATDESEDGNALEITFHVMETRPSIVAIEKELETMIDVFPNPVSHILHISLVNYDEVMSIRLLDIQGRKVFESKTIESKLFEISTSTYPSGTYFVEINAKKNQHIEKVILR